MVIHGGGLAGEWTTVEGALLGSQDEGDFIVGGVEANCASVLKRFRD